MMEANVGWDTVSITRAQRDFDLLPAGTFTDTRIIKTKFSDNFVVYRQTLRY